MVINVSKEFIFIPEFNKNKDEPEATQVRVRLRNPTVATKARIGSRPETVARADAKGAVDSIEIRMHDNDDAAIREMLVAIEGLEYAQGGARTAVRTAQQLFAAPVEFEPLRREIAAECARILAGSEVDEKNS